MSSQIESSGQVTRGRIFTPSNISFRNFLYYDNAEVGNDSEIRSLVSFKGFPEGKL